MRHNPKSSNRRTDGFTLVELLVVIAVIGLLISLLIPAISSVREAANRAMCSSRMRQCGIAMHTYAGSHGGYLPKVTGHGLDADESWIAKLGPYLEEVDVIRICPTDPEADYRLENNLTSYVLNGFCARVDEEDHADEEEHEHEEGHEHSALAGAYSNLYRLHSASSTIMLFEAAAGAHGDHVDSWDWFSEEAHHEHEHEEHELFDEIAAEIAIDRHGDGANYLYADGHVENISSDQVHDWIHEGTEAVNFARPR